MNLESQLKVQAHLDNELSETEVREVAGWLEQDSEALALSAELRAARTILLENEPEVKLSDSREFYWSKIEREIERLPQAEARDARPALASWWLRLAAPLAGLAAVLALILSPSKPGLDTALAPPSFVKEIESPVEEASVITFHSAEAGMTVVWLSSGN